MPECLGFRPLVLAHFDGECPPGDCPRVEAHLLSCEDCRSRWDSASVGVGLFLMADAGEAGEAAGGPGPAFTARVMDRVALEPRTSAPTQHLRIDRPRPLRLRRGLWAGVGAAAVAASALFVLLRHDTDKDSETGKAAVLASGGGVLRWTADSGSKTIAGSTWITKGDSSPTLPGEILHSPAPSFARVRLPEGGRLDTGPSSWLAVGGPGEAALLEGGFTVSADGTRVLELHTPAGVVRSSGEIEVSIRSAGGESRAKGLAWLGAVAAAWRTPGAAAAPLPAPPGAVMVVYAKRGAADIVLGGGPVRNSLERVDARKLKEGQALVVMEAKTFVVEDVKDDAPKDSARWTDGMPVPPGSVVFHDVPAAATPAPVPPPIQASGPVRNSLEMVLGDPNSDPKARAYALSVYEGVGGAEAVAAAARAASDASVLVRARAVRVLALNAWAAREEALAALRRLAADEDAGVARFAILAVKTLADRGAVPALQAIVTDARPAGYPAIVAKVYAFDALVALGDPSLVANAAALTPAAEYDAELSRVLQQAVFDAFEALPRDEPRTYIEDSRPAVQAAAIQALVDLDVARRALASPEERVRIAGARVLLKGLRAESLPELARVQWETPASRRAVLQGAYSLFFGDRGLAVPDWLVQVARTAFENRNPQDEEAPECIYFLSRTGVKVDFSDLLASGTYSQRYAVLQWVPIGVAGIIPLFSDPDSSLRIEALVAMRNACQRGTTTDELAAVLERLGLFVPSSYREAQFKGIVYNELILQDGSIERVGLLLAMAKSPSHFEQQVAATFIGGYADREPAAETLVSLLASTDRETAERAAETLVASTMRKKWGGPPLGSLLPSNSPFPAVRILTDLAAFTAGTPGADVRIREQLSQASSRTRLRVLVALRNFLQKIPSLGEAILSDPTPDVRLLALLQQEEPSAAQAARVLVDDPCIWVRAVALSILSESGDIDAATRLRELDPILRSERGYSGRLLGAVTPENPGYAKTVQMAASNLQQSGGFGEGLLAPDAALANLMRRTWTRSLAVAASEVLLATSDANRRIGAAKRLSGLTDDISLEALRRVQGEGRESDPALVVAISESLSRLTGFAPPGGWNEYFATHGDAYVDPYAIHLGGGM